MCRGINSEAEDGHGGAALVEDLGILWTRCCVDWGPLSGCKQGRDLPPGEEERRDLGDA